LKTKKIFIIHCRRTGYGVIRSVKEKNYEIYGADTWETPVSNSKFLKDFYVIPEITEVSDGEFLEALIRLAKKMKYEVSKPIVFTGDDNYLLFFSKYYKNLKKYYEYSFEPDYSKLEFALNKSKVNTLAQSVDVLAPKSYDMSGVNEIHEKEFPIIIKPAIKKSPEINVVEKAFRANICNNIDELVSAVKLLESLNQKAIIQQYIPGGDENLLTIGTYSYKGRIIAWSTCAKVRQFPPGTGECSFGKTIYIPELLNPAKNLLNGLSLTGISQIEFKKYDGKYYLIEINPRIWSWHQIHSAKGINFTQICLDYLDQKIESDAFFEPKDKKEEFWQFFWMDLLHNRLLNKKASFLKIIRDFFRSRQEAFFEYGDIRVFLAHSKRTIMYVKTKLLEK